ncbi:MAG: hypothetical protein R3E45_01325 [Rhodocyclaceae bacterium]
MTPAAGPVADSPGAADGASALLAGNDIEAKRTELLQYFHATFDRYESLFEVLACDEAYYKKPISLRHPLIFYFRPHRHLLHQQVHARRPDRAAHRSLPRNPCSRSAWTR